MLLDLYVPSRCAVCEREVAHQNLCGVCRKTLEMDRLDASGLGRCGICWFQLQPDGHCAFCATRHVFFDRHRSLYHLSSNWRTVLNTWKFHNERRLYRLFVEPLVEAIGTLEGGVVRLGYIGSGRGGWNVRSYQPCRDLCRAVGRRLGVKSSMFLEKVHSSSKQSTRSKAGRFFEVAGAFAAVSRNSPSEHYVLLEDVFTTGATANEAARKLKNAGVNRVTVMSLLFREDLDCDDDAIRARTTKRRSPPAGAGRPYPA